MQFISVLTQPRPKVVIHHELLKYNQFLQQVRLEVILHLDVEVMMLLAQTKVT
jgi:hypothetical protein